MTPIEYETIIAIYDSIKGPLQAAVQQEYCKAERLKRKPIPRQFIRDFIADYVAEKRIEEMIELAEHRGLIVRAGFGYQPTKL
jgi:hypothetical protein